MKTKERKKSHKAWFWNGGIAVALVAAIVVFGVMLQMEKNVLTQYEKGVIFVAKKEIPKGQMIVEENYEEYMERRELDKSCIPPTALSGSEQIQHMAPKADIEPGVLLTQGMFENINEITREMTEPVIAGIKAEDLYQVVGGTLRAGDRIHIYRMDEEGLVTLTWSNLYVQQVFDNGGSVIAVGDNSAAAQRINVYMDKTDVEKFYSEMSTGNLRVVKVGG